MHCDDAYDAEDRVLMNLVENPDNTPYDEDIVIYS